MWQLTGSGNRAVMTKCCFQVLCAKCHGRLTDSTGFVEGRPGIRREDVSDYSGISWHVWLYTYINISDLMGYIYIIIYKFKGFVLFPTPCLDFWPFPRCFVHFVPWNAIKISRQAIVYYVLKHAYYGIENLDVSTRKNSGCFKNQWWLISKSSCVVYTHILESRHPWWSWTCPSNLSFEVPRPISFSCITLW